MSNTTPYRIRVAGFVKNTTSTTAPSLTDPSLNSAFKNQVVTLPDGTKYFVDSTGNAVEFSAGAELTTTSLTPVTYNGSYVNAQADTDTKLAHLIKLSDNTYIHDGKVTWTGHGLVVGQWYYTSQTTAGGYVTPAPTMGFVQQLFFVEDANTIHVDIEEGYLINAPTGEDITSPYMVTAYSTINDAMPSGFVIQTNKYNVVDTANTLGGAGTAFDTTTYRFTPTRAGWYDVKAAYDVFRGGTAQAGIILRKNGNTVAMVNGFGTAWTEVSRIVYMNGTTDYLDAANQASAAATRQQAEGRNFFQARWLHY